MKLTIRFCAVIGATAVFGAACGGDDAARVPLGEMTAAEAAAQAGATGPAFGTTARAALDSGNALFRDKQYSAALARYRAAAALEPQHAAPYFGIYMVAQATNDEILADSARAELQSRGVAPPDASHALTDSAFKALHPPGGSDASAGARARAGTRSAAAIRQ